MYIALHVHFASHRGHLSCQIKQLGKEFHRHRRDRHCKSDDPFLKNDFRNFCFNFNNAFKNASEHLPGESFLHFVRRIKYKGAREPDMAMNIFFHANQILTDANEPVHG